MRLWQKGPARTAKHLEAATNSAQFFALIAALGVSTGCMRPAREPTALPTLVVQTPTPLIARPPLVVSYNATLKAVCHANVNGQWIDAEQIYLPHVVECENGGAPFEALKAQAIAARTYLTYRHEVKGQIADSQKDQVLTCGRTPTPNTVRAVQETAQLVMRYRNKTTAGFFVAGGAALPPSCAGDSTANTEKYVTYNTGRSAENVLQTSLGFIDPKNFRNRGCMSQRGARCLAGIGGTYDAILRSYYGEDIALERTGGGCMATTPAPASPTTPAPPKVPPTTLPLPFPFPLPFGAGMIDGET